MTPSAILRMALDFTVCAVAAFIPFYVFVEVTR